MGSVKGIGGRDVRVSMLSDPERGQQRLSFSQSQRMADE